jgi:uncharacterized protein YggE
MKTILLVTLITFSTVVSYAQLMNKNYERKKDNTLKYDSEHEIVADAYSISIVTKVMYNAVPDGYHVTYTKSFIGKTIAEVENTMNTKMDELRADAIKLDVSKKDIVIDVTSLDPIFDVKLNTSDSSGLLGYKATINIIFHIKNINTLARLSKLCLEYKIYDMINADAYFNDSKKIYDTLALKAVELLKVKKELAKQIGWDFVGGKVAFNKLNDVVYPNERYLTSYIKNASLFRHDISQNSSINYNRTVDVDNYFTYNLKDADYVFNQDKTVPVIQFYHQINYTYTKVDTEAQMREKIKKEEEKKPAQVYYIIDKNGGLKKIDTQ